MTSSRSRPDAELFPADATTSTPLSLAFVIAFSSASQPVVSPQLALMMFAPLSTAYSTARATVSQSEVPDSNARMFMRSTSHVMPAIRSTSSRRSRCSRARR